jgi:hypothetical protein
MTYLPRVWGNHLAMMLLYGRPCPLLQKVLVSTKSSCLVSLNEQWKRCHNSLYSCVFNICFIFEGERWPSDKVSASQPRDHWFETFLGQMELVVVSSSGLESDCYKLQEFVPQPS